MLPSKQTVEITKPLRAEKGAYHYVSVPLEFVLCFGIIG